MKSQELSKLNLPDEPGVYFWKKGKEVLYVGKATSLRSRVRSYFSKDLAFARSPLIVAMVEKADTIEFQKTDSVLEALILEANLIKKYRPPHNTDEKDDKSWNYVVITRERWPRVLTVRGKEIHDMIAAGKAEVATGKSGSGEKVKIAHSFGPFPHGLQLQQAMKIVRRIFPYRNSICIPKEEQKGAVGKPCFDRQIGVCPGVCTGEISHEDYRERIKHIRLFFEGKKKTLIRSLKKQMKEAAKLREFERAVGIRSQIYALGHIQDVSLIKDESKHRPAADYRIEAYDIAHTGGVSTVGVMTVVEDGEAKKSDYRMFRMRGTHRGSDTDALKEMLRRRFNHPEWPTPQLIVIDGGIAQKNAAESIFAESGKTAPIIVSVVKNERHQADHFLGDEKVIADNKKEIVLANSEAHRFAIKYHRNLRGKRSLM